MHSMPSRRWFLKTSGASLVGAGIAGATPVLATQAEHISAEQFAVPVLTGQQALQKLLDGNLRFQRGKQLWPNQKPARRSAVASKQSPFAMVFSCVDSRVPPEQIFDQGLGDIFTIRTAGHVLDKAALGSLEYGVADVGIPLLLVLGHQSCGAVSATVNAVNTHTKAPGSIETLIDYIRPSAIAAHGSGATRIDNAVRLNVLRTVSILHTSTIIKQAVSEKKLSIVGARYDLHTGVVSIIT